jgi:prenylcysteine oxidase/farnesylcysteine lyase
MLFTSALLLGLSAHLASATLPYTPKVAIIGAGAGGSSAAYWIKRAKDRIAPGTPIDVTVYEKSNYIGGRE